MGVHCPTRRQVPPVFKLTFKLRILTPNNIATYYYLSCTLLCTCLSGFTNDILEFGRKCKDCWIWKQKKNVMYTEYNTV